MDNCRKSFLYVEGIDVNPPLKSTATRFEKE